jgi:hypothetical protein
MFRPNKNEAPDHLTFLIHLVNNTSTETNGTKRKGKHMSSR